MDPVVHDHNSPLKRVLFTRFTVGDDDDDVTAEEFTGAVQSFLYRNQLDQGYQYGRAKIGTFLFLSDVRAVNILLGLNPDGTPRQIKIPDPTWVAPPGDVEKEVEKAIEGVTGWSEIGDIEDEIRQRYTCPCTIQPQDPLDRIITYTDVVIPLVRAKINPDICHTNQQPNNAILCRSVPHGIKLETLRLMFAPFCDDPDCLNVYNGSGDRGKRDAHIIFDSPHNAWDAFTIHRNRTIRINQASQSEHQLEVWLTANHERHERRIPQTKSKSSLGSRSSKSPKSNSPGSREDFFSYSGSYSDN